MNKIQIIKTEDEIEFVLLDKGNGEFTSTPKSVYDEQQAALKANEAVSK